MKAHLKSENLSDNPVTKYLTSKRKDSNDQEDVISVISSEYSCERCVCDHSQSLCTKFDVPLFEKQYNTTHYTT